MTREDIVWSDAWCTGVEEIDLMDTIVTFLGRWLAVHIKAADMEMGAFLMKARVF